MQALLLDLSVGDMDDGGMWTWAAIVTAVSLVLSYLVALGWRKWKEGKKREA